MNWRSLSWRVRWWHGYVVDQWVRPWLVRHLPRWIVYEALLAGGVRHIGSSEIVPEVPFTTVLERAGRKA